MTNLLVAPLEAVTDPELTPSERQVLLVLFSWRGRDSNTVWPGLEAIGARANIADPKRVSKITSSLVRKGWLEKKKRGYTGRNEYFLTVPNRLVEGAESDPVEEATKVAESTTLGGGQGGKSCHLGQGGKVAESTTTKVAESATCNEQTSRTNQVLKKTIQKKSVSQPELPTMENPSASPPEKSKRGCRLPDDWQLPDDWAQDILRIDPRLVRRVDSIEAKFRDYWVSLSGARAVKRDWRATWRNWIRNESDRLGPAGRPPPGSGGGPVPGGGCTRGRSLRDDLTDRSWARSGGDHA